MAEELSFGQRMQKNCTSFGKFLFDSEKGTVLGRTAKSWALIGLFYLVYYALLAGFFIGMLSVLLYGIIDTQEPMLTGDHSLLRMNPGLGMRPQPDVLRTLVKLDVNDPAAASEFVSSVDKLFNTYSAYKNLSRSKVEYNAKCNLTDAQFNKDFDPLKKICVLDPATDWGTECQKSKDYGYNKDGKPCVIVKMNKVYGWLPSIEDQNKSNHSLLVCSGETEGDKALIGNIKYSPSVNVNGTEYGLLSSALFPYLNQPGYTTPSVAVQFTNITRNVLVMVQCRLTNLKNIEFDAVDKLAMVHFEVVVFDYAK